MAEDLTLDLEELRQLQSTAKRPRVLTFISSRIEDVEKQLSAAGPSSTPPTLPTITKVMSTPSINYNTLNSFSWDQDSEKVKIYVSLEGVSEEKIETAFKPTSFDIKFHDVQEKNYRCAIPKLNKEIVPEKCKVLVKPKRVIITLFKASQGNWLNLTFKEDKVKPSADKDKDPMAGIMDLMKNMYEDGDDEMKRTIAKAWTDARTGKTADDPMKSYDPMRRFGR